MITWCVPDAVQGAAQRSVAPLIRRPGYPEVKPGPGSAAHHYVLRCARDTVVAGLLFITTAAAQDVRGLEVCTAERDMARRTGCLQANAEYLQQELTKLTRRANDDRAAAAKENAALKADVVAMRSDLAALKDALAKANNEIAELKKNNKK